MTLTAENAPLFAQAMLDLSELLLGAGAEVHRVEDTMERLGRAYGAVQTDAFVITSGVVLTVTLPSGAPITQTRRILTPGGTDLTRLEALNQLSRRLCREPVAPERLREEIRSAAGRSATLRSALPGGMLAAGAFTLFFGGAPLDAAAACIFAAIITLLDRRMACYTRNRAAQTLLVSFLSGLMICLAARAIPALDPDLIMIGDIMLLIPGIALTNAVRDVLVGDTISGLLRLIEALLWAGALAFGFMSAMYLTGMGGLV